MATATIPADLQTFVEQEVANGSYASEQDVVAEALRLLREHKLRQLREEIDAGLDQVAREEVLQVDSRETHDELFEAIRRRGLARREGEPGA